MLIFSILWFCFISGCVGCVVGMAIGVRFQRWTSRPTELGTVSAVESAPNAESAPSREEIKELLKSLVEINSQVDAQVGRHSVRITEISDSMEPHCETGPLSQAAKLLVAANQQLQIDLVATRFELEHQRELVDSFRHESHTDALTKLMNRRAFDNELRGQLEQFADADAEVTLSLLFVDIDYFKKINDVHGHLNGDQVLSTVADCLKSNLPKGASAFRYGGEEFAIILPEADEAKAALAAEQLRRAIECCPHVLDGQDITVTVSIGIAEATPQDTYGTLISRSDQALFTAKKAGRNRCAILSSPANVSNRRTAAVSC